VLSPLFERCKEKKQNVLTAIRSALDAVLRYSLLSDIMEDTFAAMTNKNPIVRLEAVGFLSRALLSTRSTPTITDMKTMVKILLKTVDDSVQDVRERSMEALGILLKIMGTKETFGFALEKLDAIKTAKVIEFSESVGIACRPVTKVSGKPAAVTSKLLNVNRKSEMDIAVKKRPASSQMAGGSKTLKASQSTPSLKSVCFSVVII
jgi:cytoskeleton-associated protein 5